MLVEGFRFDELVLVESRFVELKFVSGNLLR